MSKFQELHAAHHMDWSEFNAEFRCDCGERYKYAKKFAREQHAAHFAQVLADNGIAIAPRRLLEDLVDPDPCQWDHNHSCQAHGYFYIEQGDLCPQEEARRLLAATEGKS